MLREWDSLPPGLLEATAGQLHHVLGGPSLIHLPGRLQPPLFVSVLLHGDETTGFEAVQALLHRYNVESNPAGLPRALSIFIGNTAAAHRGMRRLEEQPDFNRIWSGDLYGDCPEKDMIRQVTDTMKHRGVFASVDIHNNTGRNPHYGCVNVLEKQTLALAAMFSDTLVYFCSPTEVQSIAFSEFCTAVTVECGQAGEVDGVQHATDYLCQLMDLAELDQIPVNEAAQLFHTTGIVKVPRECTFSFDAADDSADIVINRALEHCNFQELAPGTHFATIKNGCGALHITGDDNRDLMETFVATDDGNVTLRRPITLCMFTTNVNAVRQDCLCYFMEPYPL